MRRIQTSVIIVGGGPVGLGLAAALGTAGVPCILAERRTGPSAIPKGQNLTARTVEHFFRWGCADELRAARLLPETFPIGGITAYESLASEYWYAPPGREAVGRYFFQRNDRLPQYRTEAVLRTRIAALDSVTALFGWAVDDARADGDGALVTATGADGERCEIAGEYVVGCDGARSLVRERAGLTSSAAADFNQRMVLAVFSSPDLNAGLERFPPRTTYRVLHPELEGYWRFFGRVDPADTWFFHAPVPAGATAGTFDVGGLIERAAGFPVACEFQHVGFWDLRVNIADSYRGGRLFIAGDAAHSHPPYGGFGLNTGMEDAVNLAWKLTAAVRGWAGQALLDSYTAERHPVFADTGQTITDGISRDRDFLARYSPERDRAEFERAWQAMTGSETEPATYEPQYAGSPVVCGPPGSVSGAKGGYALEARAGHHLAPAALSGGGDAFAALGPGFTLISLAGETGHGAAAAFQDAAGRAGIPLSVVTDTFDGPRAAYGHPLILVRPDQFVAWAGDEAPADAGGLLRLVTGHQEDGVV